MESDGCGARQGVAYLELGRQAKKVIYAVFFSIFSVIFLIFFCFTFYFFLGFRNTRGPSIIPSATRTTAAATTPSNTNATTAASSSSSSNSPYSARLNPKAAASTPSFNYTSAASEDKLECTVCLMEFKEGDKGRLLMTCGHSFQAQCIDEWFRSQSTCPVCRATIECRSTDVPV